MQTTIQSRTLRPKGSPIMLRLVHVQGSPGRHSRSDGRIAQDHKNTETQKHNPSIPISNEGQTTRRKSSASDSKRCSDKQIWLACRTPPAFPGSTQRALARSSTCLSQTCSLCQLFAPATHCLKKTMVASLVLFEDWCARGGQDLEG